VLVEGRDGDLLDRRPSIGVDPRVEVEGLRFPPLVGAAVQQEGDRPIAVQGLHDLEDDVCLLPDGVLDDHQRVIAGLAEVRFQQRRRLERVAALALAVEHWPQPAVEPLAGDGHADRALARPRRTKDDQVGSLRQGLEDAICDVAALGIVAVDGVTRLDLRESEAGPPAHRGIGPAVGLEVLRREAHEALGLQVDREGVTGTRRGPRVARTG